MLRLIFFNKTLESLSLSNHLKKIISFIIFLYIPTKHKKYFLIVVIFTFLYIQNEINSGNRVEPS